MGMKKLIREDYTVGLICALQCEALAMSLMLDEMHEKLPKARWNAGDENFYTYGEINGHNVILLCLASSQAGKRGATHAAVNVRDSFPAMRVFFFVGIGGGLPENPFWPNQQNICDVIHLGDVVVSVPVNTDNAPVIEYDRGRAKTGEEFQIKGRMDKPLSFLLKAVDQLDLERKQGAPPFHKHLTRLTAHELRRRNPLPEMDDYAQFEYPGEQYDILFKPDQTHDQERDPECKRCNQKEGVIRSGRRASGQPRFHRGTIASADKTIEDAIQRDIISKKLNGAICFETEAAGVIDITHALIIRGISDYADSHKHYVFHNYAAATAAAFARHLLHLIPTEEMEQEKPALQRNRIHESQEAQSARRVSEIARVFEAKSQEKRRLVKGGTIGLDAGSVRETPVPFVPITRLYPRFD